MNANIQYEEVDLQGEVFNAHYLTYFDVAITEYFRFINFKYAQNIQETNTDIRLAKSVVEYKLPTIPLPQRLIDLINEKFPLQ